MSVPSKETGGCQHHLQVHLIYAKVDHLHNSNFTAKPVPALGSFQMSLGLPLHSHILPGEVVIEPILKTRAKLFKENNN
jgi:hypothetical protein